MPRKKTRKTSARKATTARPRVNHADKVRDHILEALKAFDPATSRGLPWRQDNLPFNASTGRCYSGMNVFLLAITLRKLGADAQDGFLTAKQGFALGGKLKKGSKGTCCLFYRPLKKEDKTTGEDVVIPLVSYFHVFHVSQFEELDEERLLSPVRRPVAVKEEGTQVSAETLDALVTLVCEVDVPTTLKGGSAFYTPSQDAITMPCVSRFPDPADWWRVWLHELVHATGAKKRLARTFGTFGSPTYAFEELVAELGSAMMSMQLGLGALPGSDATLDDDYLAQHLGYIKSWIRLMEDHDRAFLDAWSLAAKACDWLTRPSLDLMDAGQVEETASAA
jgi:antirestriction protein ArdC